MSNVKMNEVQEQMIAKIAELEARIAELEKKTTVVKVETKEMSDDHARAILFGDHKSLKHKEAAEKLGLTYGQIYSCRLGFTFKHIHKEMKEKGIKNEWIK